MDNTKNPTKITQKEVVSSEEVGEKPIELLISKVELLLNPTGDVEVDTLFNLIGQIAQRLKHDVFKVMLNHENEGFVERYVRLNQNALVRLCNDLIEHPSSDESFYTAESEKLAGYYLQVYEMLEGHLDYLERAFPAYFVLSSNVPIGMCLRNQFDFRERINRVRDRAKGCGLFRIAIKPIQDFISSNGTSYRKLYYLKGVMGEIENSLEEGNGKCRLRDRLIRCNFNSNEFFVHIAQEITDEISGIKNIEEKIKTLYRHLKSINNIAVHESLCLAEGYSPINERLASWLMDEIGFLKISVPLEAYTKCGEGGNAPTPLKLETTLTVGQLACMTRLMIEAGLLPGINRTKITRLVVQNFSAKGTKDISPASFRNSFYSLMEADRRKIKGILQNALKGLG